MIQSTQLSDWTDQFAVLSGEFCDLMEVAGQVQSQSFISDVAKLSASLYLMALTQPLLIDTPAEMDLSLWDVEGLDRRVKKGISANLGGHDVYWEYFDPHDESANGTMTLSNDLADIYGDLKIGCLAYRDGGRDRVEQAGLHWRHSFAIHWGYHVADVLRVLHRMMIDLAYDEPV